MYHIQELNGLMGDLLSYATEMCGYDVDSPTDAIDALQECGVDGAYDLISDIADIMGQIDNYNRTNENKDMKIRKNGEVIRLTESDLKSIVKRTIKEQNFDPDSYQETEDYGYNRLSNYLQPLVEQGFINNKIMSDILDLAASYADDMWREGAQGGFADR